jgi:hypothetical protein
MRRRGSLPLLPPKALIQHHETFSTTIQSPYSSTKGCRRLQAAALAEELAAETKRAVAAGGDWCVTHRAHSVCTHQAAAATFELWGASTAVWGGWQTAVTAAPLRRWGNQNKTWKREAPECESSLAQVVRWVEDGDTPLAKLHEKLTERWAPPPPLRLPLGVAFYLLLRRRLAGGRRGGCRLAPAGRRV